MTIVATAKKSFVNTYQYIFDRISKKYEMPQQSSTQGERLVTMAFEGDTEQ